ncbi:MAG: cytochrome c oxidase subunit II, partial [bacterium]
YEYPEYNIKFDSYIKQDSDLKNEDKRLLSVDNPVYLPKNKNIKIIVTADDVIHSWTIPAFGVKKDCVPGRLNEAWFKPIKSGTFYGQCSELCGALHGFMPIEVKILEEDEFKSWTKMAQEKFSI